MDDQASIPVSVLLSFEARRSKARSRKELHMYILSLMGMLGVLLQLKQGAGTASLFDTHYPTMAMLIAASIAYFLSLIGSPYIIQACPNYPDLEEFMNKLSLLFGTLAIISEVVILVPNFGLVALGIWIVCCVSLLACYSFRYLKKWYMYTVAALLRAFGKLKEYLNTIIGS